MNFQRSAVGSKVTLSEKAGVATTLTSFTVNGSPQNPAAWNSTSIPANGTISASLAGIGLSVPLDRVFVFTGADADGRVWTQQLTVPFLAPIGTALVPAISLTSPVSTVQQNPQADQSCQWSQPLTVTETGGFEVNLTSLIAGITSFSTRIQQTFGTTRLAPYGTLQGALCFGGGDLPAAKTIQIAGTSEIGLVIAATLPVSFGAAASAPATPSVAPDAITLSPGISATVALGFAGATPQWTASIIGSTPVARSFTVSPASGTGPAKINIAASAAALSPGAYNVTVAIQAADSIPQVVSVPVTLVVGASPTTAIAGLQNAFSFQSVFAPGMSMAVYGNQLSPATQTAARVPLPLTLAGVSATVNGVSAPFYFVSGGQVNVQIPYETGAGPAVLAVNNGGQVASFPFTVAATAPGIYPSAIDNTTGQRISSAAPGQVILLFMTGEGDLTPSLATGAPPSAAITNPAALPHARLPVAVTIGDVPAVVLFAGIPSGLAG